MCASYKMFEWNFERRGGVATFVSACSTMIIDIFSVLLIDILLRIQKNEFLLSVQIQIMIVINRLLIPVLKYISDLCLTEVSTWSKWSLPKLKNTGIQLLIMLMSKKTSNKLNTFCHCWYNVEKKIYNLNETRLIETYKYGSYG